MPDSISFSSHLSAGSLLQDSYAMTLRRSPVSFSRCSYKQAVSRCKTQTLTSPVGYFLLIAGDRARLDRYSWSKIQQRILIFFTRMKGKTSKRVNFVRSLIREVAGFTPYEKRIAELLKVGKDKRVLKVAKRKLGTHKRAKKKCEEMSNFLLKTRVAGGGEKKK